MSSYLIRYRDDVTVHPNPPLEFRCKAETYEDAVEKFYEEHPVSYNILDVMRESEPMGGFLTEQELLKWVGERCPEQEAGCPICKAWARHDMINHMRFEDENERIEFKEYE